MLIPRLGKPAVRSYRKSGVVGKASHTNTLGAREPVLLPSGIRQFAVVGYKGTIAADRRDAQLMLNYARGRARVNAQQGGD